MITENERPSDFIRDIIAEDLRTGKYKQIVTRFPPEPNGYLHIGHAKSICLNFGIAREFGGICNVRMDDTNPTKEEAEYVRSIMADVHWLIDGWADKQLGGEPFYASDYFDRFYKYAVDLIRKGKAYVDDMTPEETDAYRRLGKTSSFRDRSVDENLDLFARMKAGEFPDGARTLRAKIDVDAANIWLRDPVLTGSGMQRIIAPAINGAFTRCTIGPIRSAITSKASRIRFARLSSKCTGRFTIGSSTRSKFQSRVRISMNSQGSILPTP
jgi:glutaminyl-tRNA synthetase